MIANHSKNDRNTSNCSNTSIISSICTYLSGGETSKQKWINNLKLSWKILSLICINYFYFEMVLSDAAIRNLRILPRSNGYPAGQSRCEVFLNILVEKKIHRQWVDGSLRKYQFLICSRINWKRIGIHPVRRQESILNYL